MSFSVSLIRKLDAIERPVKEVLLAVMDEIDQHREASVTKTEFNELKEIVSTLGLKTIELAEAQKRTEINVKELAEAQKRTEIRVEELAEAQKRTENEIIVLSRKVDTLNDRTGGLSRSVAYSLENEAYRKLPEYLKNHHQLEMKEKFIRKEIAGKEINIFGRATLNGEDIIIIGEAVLRLDDQSKVSELEQKLQAVQKEYTERIIPLIITHFARPNILNKAQQKGVLVVQSFQWE
jgi:hypothetical protein